MSGELSEGKSWREVWESSGQLPHMGMRKPCAGRQAAASCSHTRWLPTGRWQVEVAALFVPASHRNLALFIPSAWRRRSYLAAELCYDTYLHGGRGEKHSPVTEKPEKCPSLLSREEGCHNRESAVALRPHTPTRHSARRKLWITVTENKRACDVSSAIHAVAPG